MVAAFEHLFPPDLPLEYPLRHGPQGQDLTPDEAQRTFPPLITSAKSILTEIDIGNWVLVATYDTKGSPFSFWLRDVSFAREPNLYFGRVQDAVSDNALGLEQGGVIGFNRFHVFHVLPMSPDA